MQPPSLLLTVIHSPVAWGDVTQLWCPGRLFDHAFVRLAREP